MENYFRFKLGIEKKKKLEKFSTLSRGLSLKFRVNFLAISQYSEEHLPVKFQANRYIFQEFWLFKKWIFSTFLYILEFSNGHNFLNKLDRHMV